MRPLGVRTNNQIPTGVAQWVYNVVRAEAVSVLTADVSVQNTTHVCLTFPVAVTTPACHQPSNAAIMLLD